MAKFNVTAESVCIIGSDGKPTALQVVARVTDEDGEPVTGLTKTNFTVRQFNTEQTINNSVPNNATELPGIYTLELKKDSLTVKGTVVYTLAVTKKVGARTIKGYALVQVIKLS